MSNYIPAPDPNGELQIEELHPRCVEVWFIAEDDRLRAAGFDTKDRTKHRVKLLEISAQDEYISVIPVNTLARSPNFLKPKYKQIREIVIEETDLWNVHYDGELPKTRDDILAILHDFPSAFTKDPDYGLGLAKDYRYIIEVVEKITDAETLVISTKRTSGYDPDTKTFVLSHREFDEARKAIDRINNRARDAASDVKSVVIHNALAPIVAKQEKRIRVRRNPMTKRFQEVLQSEGGLDEEDHSALVDMVTKDAHRIARSQPEKLAMLRDEVQLATLDSLIDKFEKMLGESLTEDEWQKFFSDNPFILSFVFGYPVIQVEGHASVGGKKISGGGEKIADFLYKHDLTGNTALFEIKKPQTPVLDTGKTYRGGVYGPNKELSGAISQVLDQRYQFQLHFASKVVASKRTDLSSYAVACCVIIGLVPEDDDQKKSLELIRANSRDVQIVTFDELLGKLKQLRDFLSSAEESDIKKGEAA